MVLDIKSYFVPYSMSLSRKEPVDFYLEIKNNTPEAASATLLLQLGSTLSLDIAGAKNREEIRIENLGPKQRKEWYFRIHPKVTTQLGENPVNVQIIEHHQNDFSLVKRKYTMNLTLLARK